MILSTDEVLTATLMWSQPLQQWPWQLKKWSQSLLSLKVISATTKVILTTNSPYKSDLGPYKSDFDHLRSHHHPLYTTVLYCLTIKVLQSLKHIILILVSQMRLNEFQLWNSRKHGRIQDFEKRRGRRGFGGSPTTFFRQIWANLGHILKNLAQKAPPPLDPRLGRSFSHPICTDCINCSVIVLAIEKYYK